MGRLEDFSGRAFLALAAVLPHSDLRSLSLTCQSLRAPSQAILYQSLCIKLGRNVPRRHSPPAVTRFFRKRPHLARHVQRLMLTGDPDEEEDDAYAPLIFHECVRIVRLLPSLSVLYLHWLDFTCDEAAVDFQYRHPRLDTLVLRHVWEIGGQANILEVVRMAPNCRVRIEHVRHARGNLSLGAPLSVGTLVLNDTTDADGFGPVTAAESPVIGLTTLGIGNFCSQVRNTLGPLLEANSRTLRCVSIRVARKNLRESESVALD